MDFYELYTSFTDNEILDILKKRKDYQDLAVEAAIKIAIERKIIFSEQDLFSPDFDSIKSNVSIIFPEISNEYQRQRLISSIFRFIYVISFLPLVYGFLKYAEGQLLLAFLGIIIGVIWFILSIILSKTRKKFIFILLFIILIAISLFAGMQVIDNPSFHYLDLFVLIIGTILPAYLLLLLRRLI